MHIKSIKYINIHMNNIKIFYKNIFQKKSTSLIYFFTNGDVGYRDTHTHTYSKHKQQNVKSFAKDFVLFQGSRGRQ